MRLFIALLFACTSWSLPTTGRRPDITSPPVYVQEAETTWFGNPATKVTAAFDVKAGDILVAYGGQENGAFGSMTISGGSLTWTRRQEHTSDGGNCGASLWTAVVDEDKNMSVTFGTTTTQYGGNVLTFRRSSGVGASNKVKNTTSAVSVTTTKMNSAIVVFTCDWNAADGSTRTWRTTAGAFTELSYNFESTVYTIYGGYHANTGAVGAKTVGISTPAAQQYATVAVEIKGM